MSNELESVVRPFQTGEFAPARAYFNPGQVGVPNVRLAFGRGGQGRTFTGSFSIRQTNYMTQYVNEKSNATFGVAF